MATINTFQYSQPDKVNLSENCLVVTIPAGITDSRRLLTVLKEGLTLPDYFGFNWDALSDCLRDLHWIKERNILIVHKDLPALSHTDIQNYLGVLDRSIRDWRPEEDHKIVVIFPEFCRQSIEQM